MYIGVVVIQQLPLGYHNGLHGANRRCGFHVRLVGNGATCQSRTRLVHIVGVILSSATAATLRNGEPGSGERLRLHYVSLYRSAPRGVHCSYWNQARVCAFLSSSTSWSSSSSSLTFFVQPVTSAYTVERARYAHRPGNRGTNRV